MRTNLFFAIAAMAFTTFIFSCKGKQGDPGPTGLQGPTGIPYNPNQFYGITEGYIKCTATGMQNDSSTYSYNIDFEGDLDSLYNSYQISPSPKGLAITIQKVYAGQGTPFYAPATFTNGGISGSNYFQISLLSTATNISDVTALNTQINSITIQLTKDAGNGIFYQDTFGWSGGVGATTTISNLAYNSVTKIFTGNFTFSMPFKGSASINISNGSFSTYLSDIKGGVN